MASLSKIENGLMFSDTFSSIMPIWDCFPNEERFSSENNVVSILKGNGVAELLLSSPDIYNYVIQAELDYTPSLNGNGGFIMKSVSGNDVTISIDSTSAAYPKYIRILYDDFYTITASVSYDGITFSNLGSTRADDLNKIGFYLNDLESDLMIKSMYVYKSDFIKIVNINPFLNYRVKLGEIDITDKININKINDDLVISTDSFIVPFDISVELYKTDYSIIFPMTNVFGGDIMSVSKKLSIYIDDVAVESLLDIGSIPVEKEFKLTIVNLEDLDASNLTIRIDPAVSNSNGYKAVKIAKYGSTDYFRELVDVSIKANGSEEFKLKIKRDESIVSFDDNYQFKITII